MQVPGTTRKGGSLGFKTHLAPSTVPSQCDLECGPKVIPWRGLRAGPGDHPGRGAPRVKDTSGSQCDLECGPIVIPWRGLRAGPGDHPGKGAPRV